MRRRLYILLPDKEHTRSVADELVAAGISTFRKPQSAASAGEHSLFIRSFIYYSDS